MSAFEWLDAVSDVRGTYEIFRKCVPNHMPSYESFATAVVNELRFARERQAASDVGRFESAKLAECVREGRTVPVVRVAHVQTLESGRVCATVSVVCVDGRVAEVYEEHHRARKKPSA
jgi:hypothetical protein